MESNVERTTSKVKGKREKGARPTVESGQMYTTGQAKVRANVSVNTLKTWVKKGMPAYHPDGTRNKYFFADDIQEYVKRFPITQPEQKPATKARKRKEK